MKYFQREASDAEIRKLAKNKGLPIVWMQCGDETSDRYCVVIEDTVLHQGNTFDSFFVYISAFHVFGIEWNAFYQVNTRFGELLKRFVNLTTNEVICVFLFLRHLLHVLTQGVSTRDTML